MIKKMPCKAIQERFLLHFHVVSYALSEKYANVCTIVFLLQMGYGKLAPIDANII
jgi:hypothetical protein